MLIVVRLDIPSWTLIERLEMRKEARRDFSEDILRSPLRGFARRLDMPGRLAANPWGMNQAKKTGRAEQIPNLSPPAEQRETTSGMQLCETKRCCLLSARSSRGEHMHRLKKAGFEPDMLPAISQTIYLLQLSEIYMLEEISNGFSWIIFFWALALENASTKDPGGSRKNICETRFYQMHLHMQKTFHRTMTICVAGISVMVIILFFPAKVYGLTPEYCGKRPPERWELWEGKPLKPYHFNRTLGAQKASSKYCQTSTAKQRELWEQNGL